LAGGRFLVAACLLASLVTVQGGWDAAKCEEQRALLDEEVLKIAPRYFPGVTKDEAESLEYQLLTMKSEVFEMLVSVYGYKIKEKEALDHLVDLRNECEW